jgi:AraC-like DNA-binding protein
LHDTPQFLHITPSSLMSEPVLISGALMGSRELLADFGVDAYAIANEVKLPERVFDEPDIFVPAARLVDFLEIAARDCACPAFALLQARRLPEGVRGLEIRGHGWMLMRSAQTVRDALYDFIGVYGLYTDAGRLNVQSRRGDLWLSYTFLPIGRWGETQIVELTLARMCLFIASSINREWYPAQVTLRQEPQETQTYIDFFGPNVLFGAERDAILIDHETLVAPLAISGNELLRKSPAHRPEDLDGPALITEARTILGALLRHDDCSVEALSKSLGLSLRTLQRRLTAEDTNYRELLDSVRADLAWRHIQRTDLSFTRVSDLLGYDSQASFNRAFRRWYDSTPRTAQRSKKVNH